MLGQEEQPVNIMYEQLTGVSLRNWFPLVKELKLDVFGRQSGKEVIMTAGEPKWEKIKKIWEVTKSHLAEMAKTKPNFPFVQIEGIGYVEVPAWVAGPLTERSVNLGTPLASPGILEPCNRSFKYIEDTFGLGKIDKQNIMWAGTAKEALERIQVKQLKSKKP